MIYTKQLTGKYFMETQLRYTSSMFCINFDFHYADGNFVSHQGLYLNTNIFGLLFEFNIYNINHETSIE